MKSSIALAAIALSAIPAFAQADLTITGMSTTGIVTDTQTLAVSGTLVVSIRNIGTTTVGVPFRIVAWEDRDGNRQYNSGTDVTLGYLLYSNGLAVGASADISLPLSWHSLVSGQFDLRTGGRGQRSGGSR
jgi:hypothetical protein